MSGGYARDLWTRAGNALRAAEALLAVSSDDAVSRAYYAAFHAVSAAFALAGRTFTRHTALRSAVHRDLVHGGVWSVDLGTDFDALWELRDVGDYGGGEHVSPQDAASAVDAARRVLAAVQAQHPELAASGPDPIG